MSKGVSRRLLRDAGLLPPEEPHPEAAGIVQGGIDFGDFAAALGAIDKPPQQHVAIFIPNDELSSEDYPFAVGTAVVFNKLKRKYETRRLSLNPGWKEYINVESLNDLPLRVQREVTLSLTSPLHPRNDEKSNIRQLKEFIGRDDPEWIIEDIKIGPDHKTLAQQHAAENNLRIPAIAAATAFVGVKATKRKPSGVKKKASTKKKTPAKKKTSVKKRKKPKKTAKERREEEIKARKDKEALEARKKRLQRANRDARAAAKELDSVLKEMKLGFGRRKRFMKRYLLSMCEDCVRK